MAQPDITLTIEMPPGEPDETLRGVTRDVYRELLQKVDADVQLEQGEPVGGDKCEPVTLGLIVLTLISARERTSLS